MMKKRIDYVDTFKTIGILLMIISHVGVPQRIDNYIHVFHMPMFFFISGYLFNKNIKTNEFIKRKFVGLVIPYLFFSISYYILWVVIKGFTLEPLKKIFFINSDGIPVSNGLWFLTALFFTNIIAFYINKIGSLLLKTTIIIIISFIGVTLYQHTGVLLPFSLQASFAGVGFFFVGQHIKEETFLKKLYKNHSLCSLVFVFVVCAVLVPKTGYVAMRVNCYENIWLFYPASICCCLFVLMLSQKINTITTINRVVQRTNFIGKTSLIFLCLNEPVISTIRKVTSQIESNFLNNIICCFISILILTIISVMYMYIRKNKSYLKVFRKYSL